MSHRAKRITDALKTHDYDLYAKEDSGAIRIFRKCKEIRYEQLAFAVPLLNIVRNDYLVMSLTDTWGVRGKRTDWGIEPIMARIKAMDLWNTENVSTEFFKDEEKLGKQKEKDFSNTVESFLYDFKGQLAKATNDVNTSGLNKFDKRRLGDKRLWQ